MVFFYAFFVQWSIKANNQKLLSFSHYQGAQDGILKLQQFVPSCMLTCSYTLPLIPTPNGLDLQVFLHCIPEHLRLIWRLRTLIHLQTNKIHQTNTQNFFCVMSFSNRHCNLKPSKTSLFYLLNRIGTGNKGLSEHMKGSVYFMITRQLFDSLASLVNLYINLDIKIHCHLFKKNYLSCWACFIFYFCRL